MLMEELVGNTAESKEKPHSWGVPEHGQDARIVQSASGHCH